MDFFFSPYFPLIALGIALGAIIFFCIKTIRRNAESVDEVARGKVAIKGTPIRAKQYVDVSELDEVISELQDAQQRIRVFKTKNIAKYS